MFRITASRGIQLRTALKLIGKIFSYIVKKKHSDEDKFKYK
ncbi:hypothetical protein SAMN05216232_2178 [Virgibacillus subterraneus]|uniref:Uncharacterized protein n=1 Tax=Virgibacillus subterraneus TaxID=621109 RepID=A0A1H9FF26_9BACI|nr:hypothetical protein SAMN05216232_2178 [Virgibacillus subterraneus]